MPERSQPPGDADPAIADTVSSADSGSGSTESGSRKRAVHAGDVLGRYELVEEVGEGGMATVFRARDRELRREVAVKVLFPHLAKRDDVVRRFHREARAAAALEHANILRVYDVGGGEASDPPYIVMELVRGKTLLAEIEQRGPLLAELVACVGALLADALVAAHAAGVIHRDIKPSNVLIAPGGRVLLADFGVARLETEDSLVTRTGALLGTPAYMSPEQAGGDTTTARSDLYSLGATLYQLATGSLPFAGNPAKVMASIASGSLVAPVKRRAEVGPALSKLIERMMAVEPALRPASAAEVAKELRAIAAAGGLAGEAKDECAKYFAEPEEYVKRVTPAVVAAAVAAGKQAVRERKLPRAIALADRATALAPEDERVKELVKEVTEGGRASKRNRMLVAAAVGIVAVIGAGAGVMAMRGRGNGAATVAAADAAGGSGSRLAETGSGSRLAETGSGARLAETGSGARLAESGSGSRLAETGSGERLAETGSGQRLAESGRGRGRGSGDRGGRVTRDAGAVTSIDPIDAYVAPIVPIDAAVIRQGAIIVVNDVWCDITIDGIPRGQKRNTPLLVDAGRHEVSCSQPGRPGWTKQVEVGDGATVKVEGALLGQVEVTMAVDGTIDGQTHARGDKVRVGAGRHELGAGKTKQFRDLRSNCTVRWVDESLDCVPR